jgi:rubrerythrin
LSNFRLLPFRNIDLPPRVIVKDKQQNVFTPYILRFKEVMILEKEEIIHILNDDFVTELEATMVYTRNSFVMKECDPSRVTEGIAVDEMRHMWWLADLITKRGGRPIMLHKS